MSQEIGQFFSDRWHAQLVRVIGILLLVLLGPFNFFSAHGTNTVIPLPPDPVELPDSIPLTDPAPDNSFVVEDSLSVTKNGISLTPVDTVAIVNSPSMSQFTDSLLSSAATEANARTFTPDPTRAIWLSALCPGLGQIYNRRYWKLPIVVGAFMGLAYGTSWNNMMLQDYTRAYNDITDSDPSTNSYMDFFPPTISESDLDKEWLTSSFKARKDYCRRNRDLCIIAMVGVYLIAMVDAYVDASLSQFDITPDLSLRWAPAVIPDTRNSLPGVGLHWALCF